ncbi:hypothetical protein [Cohnella sp. GbtcB17]|uniref:hypothetical protein n=1 Tax=Cohnella sp. GbtcB17 TaxID=2824762 RepID=UPI0020C6DE9C|nr:hypothetical protein [Cohnella sp. GbtcB17]
MFILYVFEADCGADVAVGEADGDGEGETEADGFGVKAADAEGAEKADGLGADVDLAVGAAPVAATVGDACSFALPPQADKATASTPTAYKPLAIVGMCMTSFRLS